MGLPITVSNSAGITGVSFTLNYDPTLLNVSGVSLASGMPLDWASSLKQWGHARKPSDYRFRHSIVEWYSQSVCPDSQRSKLGTVPLFKPDCSELRYLSGVTGEVGDQAIHKVAYLGDASGNIGYSAYDAALISRAITMMALDSGFDAYDLIDPVIIADINGNGMLDQWKPHSSHKKQSVTVAEIRLSDAAFPIINLGVDPVVSIMSGISGKPGDIVNVPVTIDNGAGLLGVDLLINYDTASLDLTNLNVSLGSLLPGWTLTSPSLIARAVLSFPHSAPTPWALAAGTCSIWLSRSQSRRQAELRMLRFQRHQTLAHSMKAA